MSYKTWILRELANDIQKYKSDYDVYYIPEKELNKLLFFVEVGHDENDNLIDGEDYIIHTSYKKSNSYVLRRISCSQEVAEEMYYALIDYLPDNEFGLFNNKTLKNMGSDIINNELDPKEHLDSSVNVNKYIEQRIKDDVEYYKNKKILLTLNNMC